MQVSNDFNRRIEGPPRHPNSYVLTCAIKYDVSHRSRCRVLGMLCGLCHVSYRIPCSCLPEILFTVSRKLHHYKSFSQQEQKKCTVFVWECVCVCRRIVNHCDDASARNPKMEISVGKFSEHINFPCRSPSTCSTHFTE